MKIVKKFIYPLYILFLIIAFFYVRSVLNDTKLQIDTDNKEAKDAFEVKPVSVKLSIEYPGNTQIFKERMENVDTIIDLLEYLRLNKQVYFELESYNHKEVILNMNDIFKNDNYEWRVYYFDQDITSEINKTFLSDNAEYTLKYEKIK